MVTVMLCLFDELFGPNLLWAISAKFLYDLVHAGLSLF